MTTRAEWSRYHAERSGPKKPKPGTSAAGRKDGHTGTARRNFSRRSAANAPYALEDSENGRPSRKSTRKSANRSKPSHPQRTAKRLERLNAR